MSWKRQDFQSKGQKAWGQNYAWDWNPQSKKKNKEKKESEESPAFFVGYDGKKVPIASDSASSQPSSLSAADQALKLENAKLKDAMKKLICKGNVEEIEEDVATFLQKDPRDEIKARQKALNEERKALNKAMKIKEEMDKKGKKFAAWKDNFQQGLISEEKRHEATMAELMVALKEAETNPEEPGSMEEDGHGPLDPRLEQLTDQVTMMQQQMAQMMSYTAVIEERNQTLTEQVSALVGAIQGQAMMGNGERSSPQQVLRTRVKREADSMPEEPDTKRAGRSRSPPGLPVELSPEIGVEEAPMDSKELKEILLKMSEGAQMWLLNQKNANPEKYGTRAMMMQLIQEAKAMEASNGGEVHLGLENMPLPDAKSKALAPFGKMTREKIVTPVMPYRPTLGLVLNDPYLMMTPPQEVKRHASPLPLGLKDGMD